MKYTILNLNRKINNKEGRPFMTAPFQNPDGSVKPARHYMIVNLKLRHEGQDIWASHFDYDLHTEDWIEGTEIEGDVSVKGEYNGQTQYIFNRPKPEQKEVLSQFRKRIGKNDVLNPQPVVSETPKNEEKIDVSGLPF